ncbi:serine O-acetyltransferase EpsC [Sphingomonas ginsenosidimutans]|jgi:serine O-acetyltransferase|uniref:serine O-acetyltransferase n=1 Tax=Sphingomonas ginsenosidimutans TaxID=862134 RepID=A0A2A4I2X4_9SPHN|nr:serine O-acetyltransferase EpsC [Sphingomonas ginsenosidimutans]PCG10631.1 serine acetyltransferase [Sphingomonas ginsenosidimutans]
MTIPDTVSGLRAARGDWRRRHDHRRDIGSFPSRDAIAAIVDTLSAALYPRRLGHYRAPTAASEDDYVAAKLIAGLRDLEREVAAEIGYWQEEASADFPEHQAATIVRLFATTLPEIRRLIDGDVEAAFLADPAARSVDEILVCYPGAIASLHHRIAHQLHQLGAPIVARLMSELANERTGVDIHPGATIGRHFFIDHGTGVVIGETAIIGDRVRLYQHVTLGARSALGLAPQSPRARLARHPIVGNDVIIYAGATILGRVTIGDRSVIGGNVWLLSDVAPDSVLVQPEALHLDPAGAADLRDTLEHAA